MARLNFNANDVEVSDFLAIPAGWYAAEITESEMKQTKSGNGEYLQLTVKLIEGDHAGRVLFERLNLVNPNATAVSIAQQTLAGICKAVGLDQIEDSLELHGKPFRVSVKVIKDQDYGDANGDKNEIGGYAPLGGAPKAAAPAKTADKPAGRPW